jgi:hypothetical protein
MRLRVISYMGKPTQKNASFFFTVRRLQILQYVIIAI